MRDVLHNTLESRGCYLSAAGSAEEGIRLLDRDDFDVILSEFELPGINGLEFFEHPGARCSGAVKVMMTEYGEDEPRGAKTVLNDVIEKPFDFEYLMGLLLQNLQQSRSVEGAQYFTATGGRHGNHYPGNLLSTGDGRSGSGVSAP
jgi:DNA-binding NtrC family response regulator